MKEAWVSHVWVQPRPVGCRRSDRAPPGRLVRGTAFSARGATKKSILEAAKEHRRELVRAHTNPRSPEATIVAPVKERTANHGGWLEIENHCLSWWVPKKTSTTSSK